MRFCDGFGRVDVSWMGSGGFVERESRSVYETWQDCCAFVLFVKMS